MNYLEVCKTSEIAEGEKRFFNLGGRGFNLAKVDGSFFAFDDVCTHAECSLADGFLEGMDIECPCHGSKFNLATGAVSNLPAVVPLKTYSVKVEGDKLLVILG